MNIFTNDDYRKIQAWLKANAIKDSELTSVDNTIPEEDTLVLVQKINGILSNVKISIKNLLNSTLSKIIIDTIIANAVKVNNTLTVTASNIKIDNEKGTTLQDIIDWAETIENTAKGWKIEHQVPSIDEPTVRAKYVLKDSKGVPKGDIIKVYKDSAVTNVYLGTTEDICNENTGEVIKKPIQNNNEALSIVYRLDTGKYSLVNVPIGIFIREAKFDKYRGLGITENGQVFIKLANDVESSNYLHFNDSGELSADGIENRILQDLGTIINSVAGNGTMWGQYKKEEGTKDSPTNEASRWGQYKQAEADRNERLNNLENKIIEIQHTAEGNKQNIEVLQNVEDYDILVSGNTEVSPNTDSVDIRIQNLDINGPSTNVETINIPAATELKAGVMSSEDKSKLNEIVALKGDISSLTEEELDEILKDNGPSIFPPVGYF